MHAPVITATYLAVLGLIYTTLTMRVVLMRRGSRTAFGDGDSASLRSAIRAHAHFAEYVPIIILMVGALELLGTPALQLHMLLGTLVASRVLHPFGLQAKPGTVQFMVGRVFGMTLTLFVLVASALLLLGDLVLRWR
jgi:uncharacterized membrane protein YecN with MAPEG domain